MEIKTEVVACLFMVDGERIVTKFPVNPKVPHCNFEGLMLDILNECERFTQIKSWDCEFHPKEYKLVVINTNHIVRIKTTNTL